MSNIPLLLLSNTFGEWLITVNNLLLENNNSSSNGISDTIARYDANGSISLNKFSANSIQLGSSVLINEVRTNFLQNNNTSVATTKAIFDLLTGSTSIIVPVKAKSLTFGGGIVVNSISVDFSSISSNALATTKAVFDLLTGNTGVYLPLNPNTIQLEDGLLITNINPDFSVVDDHTLVTSNAIMNLLTETPATVHANFASLKLNNGQSVNKIATDFSAVNDTTLATTKAVYNLFGGIDNDIGTIEGRSIDLGSAYVVNNFAIDFNTIDYYTLPTTYAVNDFLTSGNYELHIIANSITTELAVLDLITTETLFADSITTQNLTSTNITVNNYLITAISNNFNTIDDETLVTANAVYNLLTDGNLKFDANVGNLTANDVYLNGYYINAIANVIDAANTNSYTLGTTQGIYDLLTGVNSSVPPLPLSANTLTFPSASGNVVINSIATDFSTIDDNTLVTANAIYNLLIDGNVSLDTIFTSILLENGPRVNSIATTFNANDINHYTIATTETIDNAFTSGTWSLVLDKVETNQLYTYQGSVGNFLLVQSTAQSLSALDGVGNFATPYLYTAAIESYDHKDMYGSGILLSANSASPAGNTISSNTLAFFTSGLNRIEIDANGIIDVLGNRITGAAYPFYPSDVVIKSYADSNYAPLNSTGNTIIQTLSSIRITSADDIIINASGSSDDSIYVFGNLISAVNGLYNLGSSTNQFNKLFLTSDGLSVGQGSITINASNNLELNTNNSAVELSGGTTNTSQLIFNSELDSYKQTIVPQPASSTTTNILTLPTGTDQELVGTSSTQTLSNKTLDSALITGDLIPTSDIAYDLGSAQYRFRDLYLSSSSIWLGDYIKLDSSSGSFKIKKRDANRLPAFLSLLNGDAANAISYVNSTYSYDPAKTTLSELTSNDLLTYLQSFLGYENSTLLTLFPPEYNSDGTLNPYYSSSDYSEILTQELKGTVPEQVFEDGLLVDIDYSVTQTAVVKNATGDIIVDIRNINEVEGICAESTIHLLQNNVARTISGIFLNGNTAQLSISGANTTNTGVNTFDIKAVYLDNNWYANVLVR